MTSKSNRVKFDSEHLDHEIASRRRPDLDIPDTAPVPSGISPDPAESSSDELCTDAIGRSL